MTAPRAATVLALLAVFAASPRARAADEPEKQAQALFLDAMKLMGKKQYAEACAKLERSLELDRGMGTQYRLAECYEKLGRVASAYEQYTAVAEAAKAAKKPARESVARQRAAALEAKVAKLTIVLSPSVSDLPGLEVTRDGKAVDRPLWGTPIFIDPGDHVVTVKATGKKGWENKVWAEGSSKLTVSVGGLEDAAPRREDRPAAPKSKVPAIALGASGGAGLVVGAVFVGLRAGKIASAHALHDKISAPPNNGNCVGGGASMFAADCRALSSATSSGDAFGTVSVVGFVVGGAALAAMGAYLLLPSGSGAGEPRATGLRVQLYPVIGPGLGGLAASGSF